MLPSLYIPVAVNCWLVPLAIDALAGVIERETKIGALTRTLAELVTDPELALMVELPDILPITNPEPFTPATAGDEEAHVTEAVMSCVPRSV